MSGWSNLRDWRWKALAVALKAALYLFLIVAANRSGQARIAMEPVIGDDASATGFLPYQHSRDEWSYFNPVENLLAHGRFVVELSRPDTAADRMPGYGFTYLAFRLVASPHVAKICVVLVQVVASGLALYYLSLLGWMVTGARRVFYFVFALYGLSVFASVYDPVLMTESLATSALVFFLYALVRFRETGRRALLVLAGAFYIYMVFLRPFLAPLVLLAIPALWRGRRLANLAAFALVLTLVEGAWIIRNHHALGRIVPLQGSIKPAAFVDAETPADEPMQRWLMALGEDKDFWTPGMGAWLRRDSLFHDERYRVPEWVFTSQYRLPELLAARELYNQGFTESDPARRLAASREAGARFDAFRRAFVAERPFRYRVISPLRLFAKFFATTGPVLPFRAFAELKHDLPALGFKLMQVALYWIVLLGAAGGVVLIARRRSVDAWLAIAPLVFLVLLFPLFFRVVQSRMLVAGYPSLCLASALFWCSVVEWLRAPR